MHFPPEVRVVVSRSGLEHKSWWFLAALAGAQVAGFVALNPGFFERIAVIAVYGAAMWVAWKLSVRQYTETLHWTGQSWRWSGHEAAQFQMRLSFDFQGLMLVSLHAPQAPVVWLWLQKSENPLQWLALRRAVVYASRVGLMGKSHKKSAQHLAAAN
jgi:hypothetical protein